MQSLLRKIRRIAADATPRALATIGWIVRLTVLVSFAVFLMQYSGLIHWISARVSPLFSLFGLRGDAAMAFVSGYFINTYAALAVISTLELTVREITILSTMVTAAHAVLIEGAVLHKTGTPTLYTIAVRTVAALLLGIGLNWILPDRPLPDVPTAAAEVPLFAVQGDFGPLFLAWLAGIARLALMMCCLIYLLNIVQRMLYEFGIMARISRLLSPLLHAFGLPEKCSFLWIVANVIGLSYGSAAILDELSRGNISRREIDLLNTHIGISHSNFEDLILFASVGGVWYVILLARWAVVLLFVWTLRGLYRLRGLPCDENGGPNPA